MLGRLKQVWSGYVRPAGALAYLGIPICVALAYAAYDLTLRTHVDEQRQANAQRLEFLAISLESTLEKYEYLPFMVSIQRDARALLRNANDLKLVDELNVYLQLLKEQSRVAAIYLMDDRGTTLASSNWREPGSFVGQNYGFRPYFRDAFGARAGRFFAVGATTGEPGYFLSSAIFDADRRPIGVAAVKVSLDELEDAWKRGGERLLVADANGVIFLSSLPALKYRTLAPLAANVVEELKRTKQYGPHPLGPAAAEPITPSNEGQRLHLALPGTSGNNARAQETLVQARPVGRIGWRMLLFTDLESAREAAWRPAPPARS